jgi:hypothetical protein
MHFEMEARKLPVLANRRAPRREGRGIMLAATTFALCSPRREKE